MRQRQSEAEVWGYITLLLMGVNFIAVTCYTSRNYLCIKCHGWGFNSSFGDQGCEGHLSLSAAVALHLIYWKQKSASEVSLYHTSKLRSLVIENFAPWASLWGCSTPDIGEWMSSTSIFYFKILKGCGEKGTKSAGKAEGQLCTAEMSWEGHDSHGEGSCWASPAITRPEKQLGVRCQAR